MTWTTEHLFGLDFVNADGVDDIARQLLDEGIERGHPWRIVVTPNVDHVVTYESDPLARSIAEQAHLVLPDGAPIVWASRLLGCPLRSRLAGSDLFDAWWGLVSASLRPVLLLVASDELAARLTALHPLARCIVAPMFDAADTEMVDAIARSLVDDLAARPADAIVMGISMTKQHMIAARLLATEPPADAGSLVMLLGASAEFHVGMQARAPRWMQRGGLEWLHRLLSDPRRLAKRYLVDDVAFAPIVWREWKRRRRVPRQTT